MAANLLARVLPTAANGGYGFTPAQCPDLAGRVALITGGTNGIGLSLSRTLYTHNARIIVLSHSAEVGSAGVKYIKSGKLEDAPEDYQKGFGGMEDTSGGGVMGGKGSVEFVKCDLEDLKEVAKVGKDLRARLERLDIFAAIAGKGTNAFGLTSDGYDSHLTMNNIAHQLLLSHLLPLMKETAKKPGTDVRFVGMSSELHRATFGGPGMFGGKFKSEEEFKQDVGPDNLYARTKLCTLLMAKAVLQRHLKDTPISIYSTHPGAVATGQQDQFKPAYGEVAGGLLGAAVRPFMRAPDAGSLSALWACVSPDAKKFENGTYFSNPGQDGKESGEGDDQELIDNFFDGSESIIKKVVGAEGVGKWE